MQLRRNNFHGKKILAARVPTSQEAVIAYENLGGRLTVFPTFGVDPLSDNSELQVLREQRLGHQTSMETIFGDLVNGNSTSFERAILRFGNLTTQLAP